MSSCSSDVGLGSRDGGGNVREQPCCSQAAVKAGKRQEETKTVWLTSTYKNLPHRLPFLRFPQKNIHVQGYLLLELVYTYRHRYIRISILISTVMVEHREVQMTKRERDRVDD